MQINPLLNSIWNNKLRFITVFFIVFTITYAVLYVLDFLPEEPSSAINGVIESNDTIQQATSAPLGIVEISEESEVVTSEVADENDISIVATILPSSIYIEKLDKTVSVLNPASRLISDLDNALLDGVVRHPDSATLDQEGNVFILGHSSYLPNVLNKNFQAFNGIQNLEWGDTIEVSGGDKTYIYRVEKVYKAKASEVTVPIANTGNMLTIATCNSFGSTDDRHIVEATLLKIV